MMVIVLLAIEDQVLAAEFGSDKVLDAGPRSDRLLDAEFFTQTGDWKIESEFQEADRRHVGIVQSDRKAPVTLMVI
jgi:hypothetical protein